MIVSEYQQLLDRYLDLLRLCTQLCSLSFNDLDYDQKLAVLQEHQGSVMASIDNLKTELNISVLPEPVRAIADQCYELERHFRSNLLAEKLRLQNQLQMLASGKKMRNSYHAEEYYKPDAYFVDKQR